ncbi:hypothetical protein SY86_23170 [Erwinia tracheiphila]|uniref:DUF826 domain-containing protein n=2 Tax=Erwinia tracheiphila TaxID=65700 RepID=A0A0M2KKV9_9GAMM|nr:hypothetical protein ETR_20842 [Erwinia tracheiphila PSU-1]KKF37636.1 hypothetical protein SY86_23170 [Erwinia tracheiphila]
MRLHSWISSVFKCKSNEVIKMAEIKDIVNDDLVKKALLSDQVKEAVKTQIKTDLDSQIDGAVDTALADLLGSSEQQ